MSDLNFSISKDIVNPIVEAKIKDAIASALGGSELLMAKAIESVLYQKVDASGKVSSYSSDNKHTWLDIVVTKQIEEAIKKELTSAISETSVKIKDALVAHLQTKKGANLVAAALIDGMNDTFKNNWNSKVSVQLDRIVRD